MAAIHFYLASWLITACVEFLLSSRDKMAVSWNATMVVLSTDEKREAAEHMTTTWLFVFMVEVIFCAAVGAVWPLWWGLRLRKLMYLAKGM